MCILGCISPEGLAACPLCRQETPLPPNDLPTNYALIARIESQQAAGNAADVKCAGCDKNTPSTYVFACKPCTDSEKKIVLVCAKCVVKVHKAHDVVEYDAIAKAADIASVMRDERHHSDTVQRHATELAATIADEMKRIAKDCEGNVGATLQLSLMTKEEHENHAKKSSERRLRGIRALDTAEKLITRCRRKLSKIRTDDAQPSGVQQAGPSKKNLKAARAPY